jgi:hypothetical protein
MDDRYEYPFDDELDTPPLTAADSFGVIASYVAVFLGGLIFGMVIML